MTDDSNFESVRGSEQFACGSVKLIIARQVMSDDITRRRAVGFLVGIGKGGPKSKSNMKRAFTVSIKRNGGFCNWTVAQDTLLALAAYNHKLTHS